VRRKGSHLAALLPIAALALQADAAVAAERVIGIHIHSDKAMFQVLISPGKVGNDSIVLQLMNGDGSLLQAKTATVILSRPSGGVEPIMRKAALGADGYWHVESVPVAAAGRWHVRVEAETAFHTVALEEDFDLPAQ
jgi:copper transport protein